MIIGSSKVKIAIAGLMALTITACISTHDSSHLEDDLSSQQILQKLQQPGEYSKALFWSPQERLIGFQNVETIFPHSTITKSPDATQLPSASTPIDLSYTVKGVDYNGQDIVNHTSQVGMVALLDGKVVFETYRAGINEDTRWVSFSVTKSVTSMLLGMAIKDGFIKSVDEPVTDFIPQLVGTAYQGVTIENVLNMNTGVKWNENYGDPYSDVALAGALNGDALVTYLAKLTRAHQPGSKFNYNTGETNLLGVIVGNAINEPLSTYLTRKIWHPMGFANNAIWVTDEQQSKELGGCCLTATLKDFARLGQLALQNGYWEGKQILPEGWIERSTKPSSTFERYGYQWWITQGGFSASGIFGQSILVLPKYNLVIASFGNTKSAIPTDDAKFIDHRNAIINALVSEVRQRQN